MASKITLTAEQLDTAARAVARGRKVGAVPFAEIGDEYDITDEITDALLFGGDRVSFRRAQMFRQGLVACDRQQASDISRATMAVVQAFRATVPAKRRALARFEVVWTADGTPVLRRLADYQSMPRDLELEVAPDADADADTDTDADADETA